MGGCFRARGHKRPLLSGGRAVSIAYTEPDSNKKFQYQITFRDSDGTGVRRAIALRGILRLVDGCSLKIFGTASIPPT